MKETFFTRFILLVLLAAFSATGQLHAQNTLKFSVASFEPDPFDLTARNEQHKKIDGNGDLMAIVKVTSTNPDDNLNEYRFNFGLLMHEVVLKEGELWVYVQRNAKHVTVSRQGYAPVSKYDLNTTIEAGKTYKMALSPQAAKVYTQMVLFSVKPEDCRATVMVKPAGADAVEDVVGITDESGSTAKSMPFGSYTYKVVAEGYYPVDGRFTLNDVAQTHTEMVTMRPKFAAVTLRVNADADIYVNGELKGRRTWRGRLNGGTYQVECRMANHRSSSQTVVVEENVSRTIDLPLPTPITGMVAVMSQPLGASITIDGQQQGTTPRQLPQVTIGRHTIVLTKSGYENATQTFDVSENETTTVSLTMKKQEQTNATPVTPSGGANEQTFTVKGVSFTMMKVEAGSFQMGSNDGNSDEKPVHTVTLTRDLYMGETEVTQALWEAVMGNNPSDPDFKGASNPVEKVSYNDCLTFIEKLNQLTGRKFRLPTEAEWEYAARGGKHSRGYKYAGSNSLDEVAWYADNSGGKTHQVKTKKANELGLYDMSGNVWEWCMDWYGDYPSGKVTDPTGPNRGSDRVHRGGSWFSHATYCRSATRVDFWPTVQSCYLGLRLAL